MSPARLPGSRILKIVFQIKKKSFIRVFETIAAFVMNILIAVHFIEGTRGYYKVLFLVFFFSVQILYHEGIEHLVS